MADNVITPSESKPVILLPSKFTPPTRFPYSDQDASRLADYNFFSMLFDGAHFDAFKIKVSSDDFNKTYAQIRYVYVNFAGMISRLVGDFLFGEPVAPKMEDKAQQAWVEDFWRENKMDILLYESALDNSAMGDQLFKLRTGKRYPMDTDTTVILDTAAPGIYFPHVNGFDVSAEPEVKELAWVVKIGSENYLRRELHEAGMIYNELYLMKGSEIKERVSLSLLNIPGMADQQATNINRPLLLHIPNWKTRKRHFGYSDYYDLDALFFAINNRISRIDNVLDKHTDPILMVPPGVIDQKTGKVKRDGRVIEMGEGEDGKPEYVVWDASLENAFKQIEKLVDFIYMVGEVSPDAFGLGTGQSDSGRALKYKLMRTLAKVNRKKRYYDVNIKEALFLAMQLSKSWGAKVNGKPFPGEPTYPELKWADGLPADEVEETDNATKQIDAGITSQKDAIARIHDLDDDDAEKKLKEINKEKEANMPQPLDPNRNPFMKGGDNPGGKPNGPKPPQPK